MEVKDEPCGHGEGEGQPCGHGEGEGQPYGHDEGEGQPYGHVEGEESSGTGYFLRSNISRGKVLFRLILRLHFCLFIRYQLLTYLGLNRSIETDENRIKFLVNIFDSLQ